MLRIVLLVLLGAFSNIVIAQDWNQLREEDISSKGARDIVPDRYVLANLDDKTMKATLWTASMEGDAQKNKVNTTIEVMLADGSIDQFEIIEYQMMEKGLSDKYPQFKTFYGRSINNPIRRIRIDYTNKGFRAVITELGEKTFIDHYQRNDKNTRIIYRKSDYTNTHKWSCDLHKIKEEEENRSENSNGLRQGDCELRTYRLANATTAEYSNFHGANNAGDSGIVLGEVITVINRVNEVYEADITVRLLLIANTDELFYYNSGNDPYTNGSGGAMLGENQDNVDNIIGSANYDIGHVFSTGGGGVAYLGSVCNNNTKAGGVTGQEVPVGDPFSIDYVAHEIGHQFGGNHTQNNSCNRNNATAMEPGSASTIMGYAGICNPNVQNNSDAYFHAITLEEIADEIETTSCFNIIPFSNNAPTVDPISNYTIPVSTPFVLEAVGDDADGDIMSYNWEQMDNQSATMPPESTNTGGPTFRSNFALLDPARYFPRLATTVNNTTDQWEVLPSISRTMNFRVTVRDIPDNADMSNTGCTAETDVVVTTDAAAGPFLVTTHNSASTWMETEIVTVEWDVANSDQAPISCANVDILLSYDGGFTYTTTLASNVANDGDYDITVPVGLTTTARYMIRCSDNIFFDINNADIEILQGTPGFTISLNPSSLEVCQTDAESFEIITNSIQDYDEPIDLTILNLPAGATANFSANPVIPGNSSIVTIDNLDGLAGDFILGVRGVSEAITQEQVFDLKVVTPAATPSLSSPSDGETGTSLEVILSWTSSSDAENYDYELSTLPSGGNIIANGSTSNTSVDLEGIIEDAQTYYWRVRSVNSCGESVWTDEWEFETAVCFDFLSSDLPISISSSGTPTVFSDLTLADKGDITDLNVINLQGSHTYVSDLVFTLYDPSSTAVTFFDRPCNQQNNFDINLDDEAANNNWPCPPTDGGTYIPDNLLSGFDTNPMRGTWTLEVEDVFNQDGGSLESWGIQVCLDNYCDITVSNTLAETYGSLIAAIDCAEDGDTILLTDVIANQTINDLAQDVTIDKNITILADVNDNIKVTCSSSLPTFSIAPGKTVALIGFGINASGTSNATIQNEGNLILRDMTITHEADNNQVLNLSDGDITIEGNCNIE
jgi:subtilisin-like proprotein convertase family protein